MNFIDWAWLKPESLSSFYLLRMVEMCYHRVLGNWTYCTATTLRSTCWLLYHHIVRMVSEKGSLPCLDPHAIFQLMRSSWLFVIPEFTSSKGLYSFFFFLKPCQFNCGVCNSFVDRLMFAPFSKDAYFLSTESTNSLRKSHKPWTWTCSFPLVE